MKNFLKQKLKFLLKFFPGLLSAGRAIKIYVSNKKKISMFLKEKSLKLELGLPAKKQGWITIDKSHGGDLQLDITKPLPFPDNSITEIHSEHCFEHLTIDELKFCLKECFRILKVNGEISFSVPDFRRACKIYLENKEKFWAGPKPNWTKCKLDELNVLIYAVYGATAKAHKFMFDEENGVIRVEEAGFKNCSIRNYNPTKDNEHKKHQSLYFVGKKR